MTAYGSRSIRHRRSREEILDIKIAMHRLLTAEHPMTVRQVFYRLVSEGIVDKTEAQYKQTVVRLLTELRLPDTDDTASQMLRIPLL